MSPESSTLPSREEAVFKIHGSTICLLIGPEALPPVLLVPEGGSLDERLYRRVLSTYLYGEKECTPGGTLSVRQDLPPLLIESSASGEKERVRMKQEFGAYRWRQILAEIEASGPSLGSDADLAIFSQLLDGIRQIQHALAFLEKRV